MIGPEALAALRDQLDALERETGADTPVALTVARVRDLVDAVTDLRERLQRAVRLVNGQSIAVTSVIVPDAETCSVARPGDVMVRCECGKLRSALYPHGYCGPEESC